MKRRTRRSTVWTRALGEMTRQERALAGGKGGTLDLLFGRGYPVPDGFAIMPSAFSGDELLPDAWAEIGTQVQRLRGGR